VLAPARQRWAYDHGNEPYGGPVIAGETVLLGTRGDEEGHLHAVDVATGERAWRAPVPPTRTGVTAGEGLAVVGTADGLVAVNHDSGEERWRALDGTDIFGLAATTDGVYAATARGVVVAFAADGTERWRTETEIAGAFAAGRDAVAIGVSSESGPDHELVALDTVDGRERWREPFPGGLSGWLHAERGWVYAAGDRVVARDQATSKGFWSFVPGSRETPSTAPLPVGAPESVYVGTGIAFSERDYGTVYSLWDGTPGYEFRAADTVTALAGDGDGLFALVGGTLHAVDLESMAGRWSVDLGRALLDSVNRAELAAHDGICVAALDTGRLVAFGGD
jgi:outer membrane protein assembly factor BamB